MSKISIISPNWKPMVDGLSGHSFCLANELVNNNFEVNVITEKKNNFTISNNVKVSPLVSSWTLESFTILKRQLKEDQSQILFIQYAPFAYSKRGGINFFIPFFVLYCRLFTKQKVHILFHELYWPFEWKLKSLLMHFCHKVQAIALCNFSNKVFVSNEPFGKRLKRLSIWREKPIVLNSPSNLPTHQDEASIKFIKDNNIEGYKLICLFGGFHPSKRLDLVLDSLADANETLREQSKVIFIGQTVDQVKQNVSNETYTRIKHILICLGEQDDQSAANIMSICNFFICPYIDGANVRRGTLMSAMKLGLTTITCKGENFEKVFEDVPNLYLLSQQQEKFKKELLQLYERLIKQNNMVKSETMIKFYENNFSWKMATKKYLTSFNINHL